MYKLRKFLSHIKIEKDDVYYHNYHNLYSELNGDHSDLIHDYMNNFDSFDVSIYIYKFCYYIDYFYKKNKLCMFIILPGTHKDTSIIIYNTHINKFDTITSFDDLHDIIFVKSHKNN